MKQSPAVVYAEKHTEPSLDNDPSYTDGTQWYLNNDGRNGGAVGADINAVGAWAIYTGSSANKIAIIDTGVELTHEDLNGKVTGDTHSGNEHGTRVAGVAAAKANNGVGGRGVDWNAHILSYNRVNPSGVSIAPEQITNAVNDGAHVINCSWGAPNYSSNIALALAYAYKMDRTTIAAMGNDWTQLVNYPAALPSVIAVGAIDNNDNVTSFSTTGSHIDVTAPGEAIYTTTANNGYETVSGTSFAAPQVSGLASLLKGYKSNLSNDDIRQIIRLSADDKGIPGFDNQYGYGRINAGRALSFLKSPYKLEQLTATDGTTISTSSQYKALMISASGLSTGNYLVKRIEVQKTVALPSTVYNITGVWGRGVFTTGWNAGNPNFGEGFCEVVPGSLTSTSVTLRTYVYQIYNISGSYLGYYPTSPGNVTFAYSVHGLETPSISGPSHVCPGSTTTFTINNAPVNYTWGCSSNLTPVSGSLGSFTTSFDGGNAWVSIHINGAEITRKNFKIGSEIDGVEGIYSVLTARYTPEPFCPGQVKMWTLDWKGRLITEKPDTVNGYSVFGMNYVDVKSTSAPGVMTIYDLSLIQENGVTATKWISVRDVKLRLVGSDKPKPIDPFPPIDFLLSPNPATSSVTISLQENEDTKDVQSYSALSRNTLTASYTIQLWNSYSLVKSVQTDLKEYQMDLHGVPTGFYYVLVIKDGQTYRKQLMVK